MNILRSSMSSATSTLVLCALMLGTSPAANAQSKAPPQPATPVEHDAIKAAASDLYDRGVKAMDEQRWEDCRASFLAAWNIDRYYQIAGNLGACEAKLGRNVEAAEHILFALREMPPNAPADRRALAQKVLVEVRPKVAEITIRANKADAEIFIDGRSVGRSPLAAPVFADPGDRKVEAKLDGAVAHATVSATAGGTHETSLTFEEVHKGDAEGPRKELWVTGAAVAGASLIAGGIMLGIAEAKKSEAVSLRAELLQAGGTKVCEVPAANPKCDTFHSALSTRYALGNAAGWAFVGAGAVTAVTIAYVLVTRKREPPPVQAAVFVGPQGVGAALTGSF